MRDDRVTIGPSGTAINSLEVKTIPFAGVHSGTVATASSNSGHAYLSWTSASADPGKVTWAISNNVLTVTTANDTTGTLHAIIVDVP
jgi:hypothetical protein